VGAAAVLVVATVVRPLLFASIDPDVAAARGVPVRLLSVAFLVVLGVAVAEASQITGSLLVFALLVAPAATAQVVTARPALGLIVSIAVGLCITWLGLGIAYYSTYPVGFWIATVSFGAFVTSKITRGFIRAVR
jgi:zinc/manganese transport system permease protein